MRQIVIERAQRLDPLGQVLWNQHRSWYWLSKQIGISRQRIQFYRDGSANPPANFFELAAAALNVNVADVDGNYQRRDRPERTERTERTERSA